MKILSVVLMLVLSMSSFASSVTKTFFYDGSQDSTLMSLYAEETHTEYRYEQRHTTCYRTEVRYRTICTGAPQHRVCHSQPITVTIPYPCTQTISIPYEVKDYDVEASVNLSIVNPSVMGAGETFKVTLNEDQISLSAIGSKKYFIILKNKKVTTNVQGSVKFITASYAVELVEASPVVKALEMTNISINHSTLNFTMGQIAVPELIGYSLSVKKAPIFGSDTVLFDRELATSEMSIAAQGAASQASVDLQKLGVELTSGRYTMTAKVFFKHEGTILNVSQFGKTEASRTLVYKIR